MDAFRSADEVLLSGVQGITNLITTPGLINLDFADVKSVMSGAGSALMGIGSSRGEGRAIQAAGKAINSPLLEASMDGAQGVLLSIAGGSDLGLFEINEAASLVQEAAHPEANIIFGTVIDDSLGDEVRVTVIAAGFEAGGPTHKKLEPTAFRSPEKPSSGVIAPGVSGSTATSGGNGSAPQQPAGNPAPASSPSPAPAASSNGSGSTAPPPTAPAPAPAPAASPHQSGTLPPAAPPPGSAAASAAPYAPPAPRQPDDGPPGSTATTPRSRCASRSRPPAPPAVVERPAPSYTQPMDAADLDDDVDVPPFMKR